jgi:hypothetical protein
LQADWPSIRRFLGHNHESRPANARIPEPFTFLSHDQHELATVLSAVHHNFSVKLAASSSHDWTFDQVLTKDKRLMGEKPSKLLSTRC